MLRKIMLIFLMLPCVTTAQAFDRNKVNLESFWGSWRVFNPQNTCTESYQFNKPGVFIYQAHSKQLAGEFAVLRLADKSKLDQLVLDIKQDNGGLGCGSDQTNYQGQRSSFFLKWFSPLSAELCLDEDAKQCLGLFFNRKEN